jgi:hypothetical protein
VAAISAIVSTTFDRSCSRAAIALVNAALVWTISAVKPKKATFVSTTASFADAIEEECSTNAAISS